MQTITKKQLTDRIADRMKEKRVLVKQIVQLFLDDVIDELAAGNRLEFRDFGVFETRRRKPRVAQNPRTLERVHVPVKWTVKFKVGRLMKQKVQEAIDKGIGQTDDAAPQQIAAKADGKGPVA
ncbi:MAG: integration host factor subunit beta [Phycisphaerae bacterium]|nr:integration host factor subunit beta [Phycisphaerae bacterium]